MALNEKQSRFAAEYIIDLNATQAAKRAGYSEKTAYSTGQRLLKNVEIQNAIQERREELQEKTEITQERVIAEIALIAFDKSTDFTSDGLPANGEAQFKGATKMRALEKLGEYLGLADKNRQENDTPDDGFVKALEGKVSEAWDE